MSAADLQTDRLLASLRSVVGTEHVLVGSGLAAFERDWRGRYHGRARAVVRPATTEQVAEVVRCCIRHDTAIVTQGGHTGLVGGGTPDDTGSQIVVSLQRQNQIREIDADNLTMTLDAGCILQAAQEAAQAHGLLLPLSLAAGADWPGWILQLCRGETPDCSRPVIDRLVSRGRSRLRGRGGGRRSPTPCGPCGGW